MLLKVKKCLLQKVIVKTTSIKKQTSASDRINKKKMATIGYSNNNNISSVIIQKVLNPK